MTENWTKIRGEFPALQRWTYLNSATYGQMPRCAVDAITRHSEQRDELACTNFLDWYTETDRMRASIARLIHADADDIALLKVGHRPSGQRRYPIRRMSRRGLRVCSARHA